MREYQEGRRHSMLTKRPHFVAPNRCRFGIHHQQSQSSPRLVSADRVMNVPRPATQRQSDRLPDGKFCCDEFRRHNF